MKVLRNEEIRRTSPLDGVRFYTLDREDEATLYYEIYYTPNHPDEPKNDERFGRRVEGEKRLKHVAVKASWHGFPLERTSFPGIAAENKVYHRKSFLVDEGIVISKIKINEAKERGIGRNLPECVLILGATTQKGVERLAAKYNLPFSSEIVD